MDAFDKLNKNGIFIHSYDIKIVVEKYGIKELAVFGSAIRNDFTSESDIDLLIEFNNTKEISLLDLIDIQEYFSKITKRNIDIVEPSGLKNPYRKKAILESKEILYVA